MELDSFQSQHNRVPNDWDFCNLLISYQSNLSSEEIQSLFSYLASKQTTLISKNDLILLYKAKIESIRSVKFIFQDTFDIIEKNTRDVKNVIFVMERDRLYIDYSVNYQSLNIIPDRVVRSYDGEVLRSVEFPITQGDLPNASIVHLQSYSDFFPSIGPLSVSMLLDPNISSKAQMPLCDMGDFLENQMGEVFESQEITDSHQLILVSNLMFRFYLDPEKDFSVVKYECLSLEQSSNMGMSLKKRTDAILSNFFDCGNGIWIPGKTEIKNYVDNEVVDVRYIFVSYAKVNEVIEDSFFSKIIPDDAFVVDKVRNLTYMQSDNPSINSLLKETAKSKRVFIYRYISVITGLVLIFIVLVIKYRLYLKDKRERENKTVVEEEIK
jgi:hypothetical protein